MFEEAMLAEQFEGLLKQTREAEGYYASLADQTADPAIAGSLRELQREKQRHIRLAKHLLRMVE